MGQPIKLGQNDFEAVYDLYRYAFIKSHEAVRMHYAISLVKQLHMGSLMHNS